MYKVIYTTRNGSEEMATGGYDKESYDSAHKFMLHVSREYHSYVGGSFVEGMDSATVTSRLGEVYTYEIK